MLVGYLLSVANSIIKDIEKNKPFNKIKEINMNDTNTNRNTDPSKTKEVVKDGKVIRQKVYYASTDGYYKQIDTERTLDSFSDSLDNLQYTLDEIAGERNSDYAMDNMSGDGQVEILSELAEND